MLTVQEAARELGVSARRVQELIADGVLKGRKLSGVWIIDEESVMQRAASAVKSGRPRKGKGRNETEFTLMNRTHEIVAAVYNSSEKRFTAIGKDINAARAPIGLMEGPLIPLESFNAWWRGRGIPETRHNLASLLEQAGVALPQELLQRNLGLSLSDQYWIKPEGSSLTWEEINFFTNDFERVSLATERFATDGKCAAAKPDNTSDGNLEKTWTCRNGVRVLLKSGTRYGQEPYNEAAATALHRRLLAPESFVTYTVEGEGAQAHSCCENFLSDQEEYVPAIYVMKHLEHHPSSNDHEHYLACCESLGAAGAKQALDRMIVCDDIIANHDRHFRNFGLIRNVETLECRPAPIFDSGSSLWCDTPTSQLASGERSFTSRQFYASPAKQMLLVDDMGWLDIDALDGFVDETMGILSANDALSARLPFIRSALARRLERMIRIAQWD